MENGLAVKVLCPDEDTAWSLMMSAWQCGYTCQWTFVALGVLVEWE